MAYHEKIVDSLFDISSLDAFPAIITQAVTPRAVCHDHRRCPDEVGVGDGGGDDGGGGGGY